MNLMKCYFLLRRIFSSGARKIFKYKSKRRTLFSVNRIFASKVEMKHTNNKVIITLYSYNKERNYFIRKF